MITIERVQSSHGDAFARLWLPWLRELTGRDPEPEDVATTGDPAAYFSERGGVAFVAMAGDVPVGMIGVRRLVGNDYEFIKLLVADAARGQGLGRRLIAACEDFVATAGGGRMWLQTLRCLDAALVVYRRMGYVEAPPPPAMTTLQRTELIMVKPITAAGA